jgi:peptidoglycan/xylan/chitin deacetylase (PgdA/CDA1 family)
VFAGLRRRPFAALCVGLLGAIAAQAAAAADCPGHPDAIGTSRTIVVDPRAHPVIGTMQYAKTLPLEDHEVVLTFDDGPLPKYSYQILNILAAHCAKATFFLVGRQAQGNPEGVRKVRDAGHTVATHTQNHPAGMHRLPLDRSLQEIEQGIASVTAALGGTAPAPFLRIPGLRVNDGMEAFARAKGLQIWSADFPADDWRDVTASRVYELAIQRLEAKGKGILLLHDIQPRTVEALPRILHELKARGYRIVHVVPAAADRPATPTEPPQWQLHPPSETVAISRWPKVPKFAAAGPATLPAPTLAHLDWHTSDLGPPRAARRGRSAPGPSAALWPQPTLPPRITAASLPVPAVSLFKIPESTRLTLLASPTRRADAAQARATEASSAKAVGKPGRPAGKAAAQPLTPAGHGEPTPQSAGATVTKAAPTARRNGRSAHVAGLKKR